MKTVEQSRCRTGFAHCGYTVEKDPHKFYTKRTKEITNPFFIASYAQFRQSVAFLGVDRPPWHKNRNTPVKHK